MKRDNKKILVFIIALIILMLLFNILYRFVLPIKPVRLNSMNMKPTYLKNDVLFYNQKEDYKIDEVVIITYQERTVVTRIVSVNDDGTFNMKGDFNSESLAFEQNVEKEQIKGKIEFSMNPFIFYILSYGIEILLALLLTKLYYKRDNK